jgi:hypothetical protein
MEKNVGKIPWAKMKNLCYFIAKDTIVFTSVREPFFASWESKFVTRCTIKPKVIGGPVGVNHLVVGGLVRTVEPAVVSSLIVTRKRPSSGERLM